MQLLFSDMNNFQGETSMAGFFGARQQTFALALLSAFALFAHTVPTLAQDAPPARLRGTIEAIDGQVFLVKPQVGESVKVRLIETARKAALIKASLADVKPGSFVGITSAPGDNGSRRALEIHIFPESLRGTGEGHRPWDLGPQTTMTNGNIDTRVNAVAGEDLTVSYKGGSMKIQIVPDTAIVTYTALLPEDIKPGNKAIFIGLKKGEDGILEAAVMSIGRDGLTPPM
jgi:hypothetical protein